ncbi:MAG: hypothetical protein N4A31_07480 [Rickettsiales bacterium]|jgi:hypothetical protein|nr:hypothetical protein [Rickettsiales bacterium]
MSKAAKTASKNNPTSRMKAADVFFNDKKVEPVLVLDGRRRYMAAAYEDGSMPLDADGSPLPWADVTS